MARSLAGGRERTLVEVAADAGSVGAYRAPTGRACAPCELTVVTVATGETTIPATGNFSPLAAWSPNGRFLIVGAGGAQVMDTVTGQRWPLTITPLQGAWYGASWAPDGSYVVLDVEPQPRNEARLRPSSRVR